VRTVVLGALVVVVVDLAVLWRHYVVGLLTIALYPRPEDLSDGTAALARKIVYLCMLVSILLIGAWMMAGYRLVLVRWWRGMRLEIDGEGIRLTRGGEVKYISWRDAIRVPLSGDLCVVARDGERIDVARYALDVHRFRFPDGWRRVRSAGWLPVLARAYCVAARRGLSTALDEPPRLYMRTTSGPSSPLGWVKAGCAVGMLALMLGGALLLGAGGRPLWEIALLGGVLAGVVVLGGWAIIWVERRAGIRIIKADERGLMVKKGEKRRLFGWNEVSEIRPAPGSGRQPGAVVQAGDERALLEMTFVRYANLSLLSRLEDMSPQELLLAAWRCYRERGPQTERS
jgi:hypothetical protein